jgi:hypothetical protein
MMSERSGKPAVLDIKRSAPEEIRGHERKHTKKHEQRVVLHEARLKAAECEARLLDDAADGVDQAVYY